MSVQTVQVAVVSSVRNLFTLVKGVVSDVKAGKSPATVVADAVPQLVSTLSSLGDLGADVADRKDLVVTVALGVADVVNAFLG